MKDFAEMFVPFATAQKLKRRGFRQRCFGCHTAEGELLLNPLKKEGTTPAPMWHQVLDYIFEETSASIPNLSFEISKGHYTWNTNSRIGYVGARDFKTLDSAVDYMLDLVNIGPC